MSNQQCMGNFAIPLPPPPHPHLTPTQIRDLNFFLYGPNSSGPPSPFDCNKMAKKSFHFLPNLRLCDQCYNQTKIIFSKNQKDEAWKKMYLESIIYIYGIEATISDFESEIEQS